MTRDRRGVFVSYARRDGAAFARRLVSNLGAQGIEAWLDRREMYGGWDWRRQVDEAIGDAAFLVLVMTPAALASEIVGWEWQAARRQGVCVFPIRADPAVAISAAPRWMRDLHWYTLDEEWDTLVEDLRAPCKVERVPFMARDLPSGYVPRGRELLSAKRLLLDDRGDPIAAQVVLHGAPGYGKTTLALALCHDEDVRTAFHDGVLWVSLGEQPDLLLELDRLHGALTGRSVGASSVEDAARTLRDRLRDRRCLLVIDDVWRPSHLSPFQLGAPRCASIVTTRQFDVALAMAESTGLWIDKMSEAEAVDLVTAGLPAAPADPEPYRRLVDRLGAWPLLVSLARGALRARTARGASFPDALAAINSALDRRSLTAFDASRPDAPNEAAAASVAASLEQLSDADVTAWADLAVFPEDTPVPIDTVAQLWATDRFTAEERATRLADTSLLHLDVGAATIDIHDVLLAVAQRQATDPASLHRRLLDSWGDPRAMPRSDRYAWQWITHHLVGAGRENLLTDLLLDPGWMEQRLEVTTVEALLADFDLIPAEEPYRTIRQAIRMSAGTLATDSRQLAGQLRGRLLSASLPGLASLLDSSARLPGPRLVPLRASLRPPPSAESNPMLGHDSPVAALTAADGGRVVVSGSGDRELKVWDVKSGALRRTIDDDRVDADPPPHPWEPQVGPTWGGGRGSLLAGFAASPRVVASAGHRLTIWDLDSGARLRVFEDEVRLRAFEDELPSGVWRHSAVVGSWIRALAVSPDDRYVVFGAGSSLCTWDLETGVVHAEPGQRITTLAFDGSNHFVSGSSDLDTGQDGGGVLQTNALRVWDAASRQLLRTLEGHPCGVNALAVHGRLVASAPNPGLYMFQDPSPRLWDITTGEEIHRFERHVHTVRAVAITPDERLVISGGGNCFQRYQPEFTVKLWDVRTGKLSTSLEAHRGPVVGVGVTPDSRWAITAGGACSPESYDGSFRVWDLRLEGLAATFQGDEAITCLLLPDPKMVVGGSQDGGVHILRFDP